MSISARANITFHIKEYIRLFPTEWEAFKTSMGEKRMNSVDDFGRVDGSDMVERKLHEIPETLYTLFKMGLDEADWGYFESLEGGRWLAKRYPEFRTSERT